jgi:hypothetical protein
MEQNQLVPPTLTWSTLIYCIKSEAINSKRRLILFYFCLFFWRRDINRPPLLGRINPFIVYALWTMSDAGSLALTLVSHAWPSRPIECITLRHVGPSPCLVIPSLSSSPPLLAPPPPPAATAAAVEQSVVKGAPWAMPCDCGCSKRCNASDRLL